MSWVIIVLKSSCTVVFMCGLYFALRSGQELGTRNTEAFVWIRFVRLSHLVSCHSYFILKLCLKVTLVA